MYCSMTLLMDRYWNWALQKRKAKSERFARLVSAFGSAEAEAAAMKRPARAADRRRLYMMGKLSLEM